MITTAARRGALFATVAAVFVASVWTAQQSANGAARAAATTTYTRTYVGLDFRPLDTNVFPELAINTGGGIYPLALGKNIDSLPDHMYFEARVEAPVGAKITEVTFYYCGPTGNATFYLGDYKPSALGFNARLPEANPPNATNCSDGPKPFTRTGTPIVTTAAGHVYHLGVQILALGNFRSSTPIWLLYGARVRYTCTATSCT